MGAPAKGPGRSSPGLHAAAPAPRPGARPAALVRPRPGAQPAREASPSCGARHAAGRATPQCGSPDAPRPGPRFKRRAIVNCSGALGQPNLLSVRTIGAPTTPPYEVSVRYDLRSVRCLSSELGAFAFVAAFDVRVLRRRGAAIGLDAMKASEHPLARDCLCSAGGRLRPLGGSWDRPGEVRLSLTPWPSAEGDSDVMVMFRVVAFRSARDAHDPIDVTDWRAFGAPVVLRLEFAEGPAPSVPLEATCPSPLPLAEAPVHQPPAEAGCDSSPAWWGVELQQVLSFYSEIRQDLTNYVAVHRIRVTDGCHVCMHEPCPFRPIDKDRYDDHRGAAFLPLSSIMPRNSGSEGDREEGQKESELIAELVPSTHLVVDRYIKPRTQNSGKSMALLMNAGMPLKVHAFVTHCWATPFSELVDALQMSVAPGEPMFLSCLSMDHHDPRPRASDDAAHDALAACPALAALAQSKRLVVAIDAGSAVLSRLWCLLELSIARDLRIPTLLWPHAAADVAALEALVAEEGGLSLRAAASQDGGPALRAALAGLLGAQELREPFHSALEREQVEQQRAAPEEAVDANLRRFLRTRLCAFKAALRQLSDFPGFSAERLRQLHTEQERRATVAGLRGEHRHRAEHMSSDLVKLREQLEALEAAQAAELAALRAQIHDAARQGRERLERLGAETRGRLGATGEERRRVGDRLAAEAERSAGLAAELAAETGTAAEERRALEEARSQAETLREARLRAELELLRATAESAQESQRADDLARETADAQAEAEAIGRSMELEDEADSSLAEEADMLKRHLDELQKELKDLEEEEQQRVAAALMLGADAEDVDNAPVGRRPGTGTRYMSEETDEEDGPVVAASSSTPAAIGAGSADPTRSISFNLVPASSMASVASGLKGAFKSNLFKR